MKLFVFGAGASKASQVDATVLERQAPLVNGLFDERYRYWADIAMPRADFEESRAAPQGQGVEQWLTTRWDEIAKQASEQHQRAEKVFFARVSLYIWRLFQGVSETYNEHNLYRSFMRELRRKGERFGLLSFNYDTLLDRAFTEVFGVAWTHSVSHGPTWTTTSKRPTSSPTAQ